MFGNYGAGPVVNLFNCEISVSHVHSSNSDPQIQMLFYMDSYLHAGVNNNKLFFSSI